MKMNIPALTPEQVRVAKTPELGVESKVYVLPGELYEVGTVTFTGVATSSHVLNNGIDLGSGRDLFLRVEKATRGDSAGAITVQANVTFNDDSSATATATFDIPSWATYQENVFPIGQATDFVPDNALDVDKKIKSVDGIAAVTNGAAGLEFKIYATPDMSDFTPVGITRSKAGPQKLPMTIPVAEGYDGSRYVKLGRSESQNLNLSYVYVSSMEQLHRMNGHRCLILIETVKDDAVLFERILYSGCIGKAQVERGDGDDEVVATSDSLFEVQSVGYAR